MTPSSRCVDLVRGYEQCRLKAYKPTPDDVWTLGWGSTRGVKQGDVWTQAQADGRFTQELTEFACAVWARVGSAPTTQGQFDAMVSLAYNIGETNFRGSSVATNHRLGHNATAALAFSLWNKQRDKKTGELKVLNGLTKRRAAEAAMYRA